MNKRIKKMIIRLQEGNMERTFRRDQIKKAMEEGGFDYIIYRGYDEVYNVEPVKKAAKVENIKDYWWRGADIWGGIKTVEDKRFLVVTMQFGYSYMDLYAEIKEEVKKEERKEILKKKVDKNITNTKNKNNIEITYNKEKNGIEISFTEKPEVNIIEGLKENGFRWHRVKKIWYAKNTEERRSFINSLLGGNTEENKQEEKEIAELKQEGVNVEDFNVMEQLKNKYVINWNEIPEEIQQFILSCDSFNIDLQECLLYKEDHIVASLGINILNNKIEVVNAGSLYPLFQWDQVKGFTENGLSEDKKARKNKVSFKDVKLQEVKEDIFVNALVPAINKNCSKKINDKEIQYKSYLEKFKITNIVELTEEQYDYFINNLLKDYKFLSKQGGWEEENGEVLYYIGVAICCKGKETLLIDPSGSAYARYLNKIVEDIDGSLKKKIDLVMDNKNYLESVNNIKENSLYITKFSLKTVVEDSRIILNRGLNDKQVATGLAIKEMLKESKSIDILNLEEYEGDLDVFKEQLQKVDDGDICILMPNKIDIELSNIKFVDRLEAELSKVKNIEKNEELEEMENNLNFDDILSKFDSVEINNSNRLCTEDQEKIKEFENNLNKMKENFKIFLDFYNTNDLLNYEGKRQDMNYNFKKNTIIPNFQRLISGVYSYFNNKYNLKLEKININEIIKNYKREQKINSSDDEFNWYMEEFSINILIDNIFEQLKGVDFKTKELEELKETFKYKDLNLKGSNITIQNYIYFNEFTIKYNKKYEISYSSKEKIENLFNLIEIINNKEYTELKEGLINRNIEPIGVFELEGEKIKALQIFKNGNVKITFNSGMEALKIAQEYLNYNVAA